MSEAQQRLKEIAAQEQALADEKKKLLGAEQHQQEVDDAAQRLESRIDPVYHSVRRQDAQGLIAAPFTQNAVHPQARFFRAE